ncbi:MAG TPA: ATP-grasp ribosomal peptide maturase [Pseudonocardiaceae bacterium]|jgi:ATP-grasp ribosomal peptide maturase|nr:ATP-grasp ribosomal peptide maturase [Pseudonocardiaceae bacterium]
MAVLILTGDLDSTADHMVEVLGDRGVEVHRINTAWFPSQLSVAAELRGDRWVGALRTPHRVVDLETITSVWYRAPEAYQFAAELSAAERQHANMEAKYGLGGILASLPALWVNHPSRMADIAYKPVQLVTAARCGLVVPGTLIANEPAPVQVFAREGQTVTKMIGASSIIEQGKRKIGFTRLVDPPDLDDLRGVEQTTHLFQRWVPKAYEARLIVIGDHITSTTIHAGSTESYVDFRTDYDANTYCLIDTPGDVADGVRRFMSSAGLLYAAFDFVVMPEGQWVFLEANAGGQYGFVEHRTGAPLTAQLADLLAGGSRS